MKHSNHLKHFELFRICNMEFNKMQEYMPNTMPNWYARVGITLRMYLRFEQNVGCIVLLYFLHASLWVLQHHRLQLPSNVPLRMFIEGPWSSTALPQHLGRSVSRNQFRPSSFTCTACNLYAAVYLPTSLEQHPKDAYSKHFGHDGKLYITLQNCSCKCKL